MGFYLHPDAELSDKKNSEDIITASQMLVFLSEKKKPPTPE